ncbi:MAG: sulfatase, partial [Akkermansiaceae bacterium]
AHQKKPFFLYLAYRAPHVPLDAPKKYLSRFPGKMPERRRQALAMISAMDDGVGSITAELKKLNLTKDTLIFFIGDNGAPLKIHKRDTPGGGPGWDGSLNKPMNGEKGMLTEGGIRVPFVVSWPGTLPEGKTYDHPIIALDATATALDLAGIEDTQLDGTNLIPYLSKNTSPQRTLKWRWVSQAAIRDQNWKLLVGGDRSYLFNLKDDPGELKNLLDQQPEIAKRLRKELTAWSSELKPAGLKTDGMTKTWSNYYDFYLDKKPAVPLRKKFIPQDPLQIRNATARKEKTNLKITPGKQRPFAVITNLNLQGAVTATIKIRSVTKGEVGIAWRKDNQKKFPAAQFVEQKIEGKPNWQTITLRAPENLTKGKIVHLRILLPQSEITLGEITLQDSKNTKNWHPGNTQQQR